MKKINKDKSNFRLSRRENLSLLLLMIISSIIIIIPYLYRKKLKSRQFPIDNFDIYEATKSEADSNKSYETKKYFYKKRNKSVKVRTYETFDFDPNSLSEREALLLGFSKYSFSNLQKYREKGGVIRSADDLRRIFGVSEELVKHLTPYIIISDRIKTPHRVYHTKQAIKPTQAQNSNLNSSSAYQLSKYLSIDFKLACRIVNYGQKLGLYHSVSQLKEVYEMSDSVYQRIESMLAVNGSLIKIDLINSSWDSLSRHPYIGKKRAGLIIKLRDSDPGSMTRESIRNIYSDNPEFYQRLLPYLNFSESVHPHVQKSQ